MTEHTYDSDTPLPPGEAPKKKKVKKKRSRWLEIVGSSMVGAIAGAVGLRAFDKHILGRGAEPAAPPPTDQPPVQQNPTGFGIAPMIPMMPMFQGFGPAPAPAPTRNPEPEPPDDVVEDLAELVEQNWEERGFED